MLLSQSQGFVEVRDENSHESFYVMMNAVESVGDVCVHVLNVLSYSIEKIASWLSAQVLQQLPYQSYLHLKRLQNMEDLGVVQDDALAQPVGSGLNEDVPF